MDNHTYLIENDYVSIGLMILILSFLFGIIMYTVIPYTLTVIYRLYLKINKKVRY